MKTEIKRFMGIGYSLLAFGLMIVASSEDGSLVGDLFILAGIGCGWYWMYETRATKKFSWYLALVIFGYFSWVFVYNFTSVVLGG
jgi:hypothetical protein